MALFLRKFPYNDLIVVIKAQIDKATGRGGGPSKDEGKATDDLAKWAESLGRQVEASPVAPEPAVQLPDVSASATDNFGAALAAGLYRINVYREVTVADPVSSSLAVVIGWTHNGKALTRTLSAFAGAPQAITDTATDVTIIEIDPNSTVSYTLTYASNTPLLARFHVTLIAELLQTLE